MTSTVRIAVPTDEAPIVEILRLKHAEDGNGGFDESMVRAMVQRGIRQDYAMIGVIRGVSGIEATIGLFIGALWTSQDQHLSDLWHFVMPPYRKSSHGKALLEFAKWTSSQLDRPLMMLTIRNEKTAKKCELYERQLGPARGFMFQWPPSSEDAGVAA